MLFIQAALREFTGSLEMLVFQMLSAGNIGQPGAPGTVVLASAALAAVLLAAALLAAAFLAAAFLAAAFLAPAFLAAALLAASALTAAGPAPAVAAGAAAAGRPATCAAGLTCAAQAVTVPRARSMASGTTIRRERR
jgi:hypothetical protein